jgi:hypothetical protein
MLINGITFRTSTRSCFLAFSIARPVIEPELAQAQSNVMSL